jgi:hypothetical protein
MTATATIMLHSAVAKHMHVLGRCGNYVCSHDCDKDIIISSYVSNRSMDPRCLVNQLSVYIASYNNVCFSSALSSQVASYILFKAKVEQ